MPEETLPEEIMFEYGVFFSVKYSWERSSHDRGEAPDTEDILRGIQEDINTEECLRMEAEFE